MQHGKAVFSGFRGDARACLEGCYKKRGTSSALTSALGGYHTCLF